MNTKNLLDIEYLEEQQFIYFDFPKESLMFLNSLTDNIYTKIFQLFLEEISIKDLMKQAKATAKDIRCLIWLLQSFWGYRHQEKHILNVRKMSNIKYLRCDVPEIYLIATR